MPLKSGALTAQERVFAEAYADTGDTKYAADVAAYKRADTSVGRLLRRPAVIELIEQRTREQLTGMLPACTTRLRSIISDPKSKNADAIQAIKLVLGRTLGEQSGEGRELYEMSLAEIDARIARLRDEAAARATPLIEGDVVAVDVPGEGVFE